MARIIIAGAGIGGLTAALSLQARGHQVQVLEASREIRPLGVGINLLPHSMAVLNALGLEEALLAEGVATAELVYFSKHGQRIWSEPRGRAAGYPVPQVSIHRGRLQGILLETARARLGKAWIAADRRLIDFEQAPDRVTARFSSADGLVHVEQADLLVAADGIHSAARRQLFPQEGPPVWSGRTLWRGASWARPFLSGATMIMAGHQDQKFVAYPVTPIRDDGLQLINWIAELASESPLPPQGWNRAGRLEDFLPAFEAWRFDWLDAPGLIRAAEAVFEYPMVDRDPLPRWSHGRVTLLGDAGHPMYPIGSNGASQAILDAQALGEALGEPLGDARDREQDIPAALAAYDQARRPATAAIVLANRGNGPEECMQIVETRSPGGFANIDEVISRAELETIAARYKQLAGFATDAVRLAS
jgi:2-polyprenyl-6-methoxyphenol hydroxylase-like FAD-dependent oxidoreductase